MRVRCEKDEFIALFKGHADIKGTEDSSKMKVVIDKPSPQKTTDVIGETFGLDEGLRNWMIRRRHGSNLSMRRDCSYIDVKKDVSDERKLAFAWEKRVLTQLDHSGTRRTVPR